MVSYYTTCIYKNKYVIVRSKHNIMLIKNINKEDNSVIDYRGEVHTEDQLGQPLDLSSIAQYFSREVQPPFVLNPSETHLNFDGVLFLPSCSLQISKSDELIVMSYDTVNDKGILVIESIHLEEGIYSITLLIQGVKYYSELEEVDSIYYMNLRHINIPIDLVFNKNLLQLLEEI